MATKVLLGVAGLSLLCIVLFVAYLLLQVLLNR
jgi:hypothetical protein